MKKRMMFRKGCCRKGGILFCAGKPVLSREKLHLLNCQRHGYPLRSFGDYDIIIVSEPGLAELVESQRRMAIEYAKTTQKVEKGAMLYMEHVDFDKEAYGKPEPERLEELMSGVVAEYTRTLEALASGEAINEQEFFANHQ